MEYILDKVNIVDENQERTGYVHIKDDVILEIGDKSPKANCKIYNCQGLTLMPSFVDLHAHFRDPGYTYKETIETGSKAALRGGYSLVNLMANTKPIASTMEEIDYVLEKSKKLDLINIHQCASLTENFDGKTIDHLEKIDPKKVLFISDDGKGVISNITSYNSMLMAKEKGLTIMTHAEDMNLTPIDYRISENIITFRDLYLCQVTGARLHLSHVSTKEAIKAIRQAKKEKVNVSCEVTPHHIMLHSLNYKVNPPIREKEDTKEIIKGIIDGTVDAISTDHAPHTMEEKQKGAPGMVGLETAFAVCYTALVKEGYIDLKMLSKLMSANPYKIFEDRYPKRGHIKEGNIADLVLIDTEKIYTVNPDEFASQGRNTAFEGMKLQGEIKATIKDGKIKYDNYGFDK